MKQTLTNIWKKYPYLVVLAVAVLLAASVILLVPPIFITNKINSLPTHPTKDFHKRALTEIQRIAVHHSAADGQTAEDYARYHVRKGWPGIGYHFVIEANGQIVQTNALDSIAYNVDRGNTPTVGICLSGDFSHKEPSPAQLKSLGKLIRHLRRTLNHQYLPVGAHRDLQPHKPTSCPGSGVVPHLAQYNRA